MPEYFLMNNVVEEIRSALSGRHSLLYLQTPEEDRVLDALHTLLPDYAEKGKISTWSCVTGLDSVDSQTDTRDPLAALQYILNSPHEGFYLLKDITDFMDRADVIRALRNAYHQFIKEAKTALIIVSPELTLPAMLEKEICLVEIQLPDAPELLARALAVEKEYDGLEIPKTFHAEIALALRGLTLNEAGHVMHRIFKAGSIAETDILDQIFTEKKMLMRKSGFLEYIPNRINVDDVGGLEVLKDWAVKRKNLFTQEAVDANLPIPRGILIMGVSGCGKSMSAKAIASTWRLPLFRLDMNLVFSGLYGSPETAFHKALKSIESIAPAVLWIDEIENALGMTSQVTTSEQSLTFSAFLTWMQERPPLVFVAATANRIEALPAEVIRKGRFDEVFFCDLPGEKQRREIITIHVRLNGADPETIQVDRLLHSTKGWSGAEIEQAVIAARIDASKEGRTMTFEDIRHHTTRMVPLSTTMSEQIRAIRSWSYQRATLASNPEPKSMIPDALDSHA